MRTAIKIITASAILLGSAAPALAKGEDSRITLVNAVQSEAAWRGVEVDRVRRDGQDLNVQGVDRQGRTVTLVMDCAKLGVACSSSSSASFAVVAR